MENRLSVEDRLVHGRQTIADNGWFKGGQPNDIKANCASTALTHIDKDFSARYALADAIGLEYDGSLLDQLYRWNDAEERTVDDVLEAYDLAIAKEREKTAVPA